MLDLKEEARFADLKNMCRELKVLAPPEIMIGLQVHDHNGVLTIDDIQRGHSWTRNFYNFMFDIASHPTLGADGTFGAAHMNIKNTAGTISITPLSWSNGAIQSTFPGAVSITTYGIVVGTGDTAFSAEDYILSALIAQGVGAGQFSYQGGTSDVSAYNAGTKTWKTTQTRIMNNNSGGSITVKEVGIIAWNSNALHYSLWERSVLSPTVAVANGAQLTVTYEISMDFSAID
jgi:hypothetical protein